LQLLGESGRKIAAALGKPWREMAALASIILNNDAPLISRESNSAGLAFAMPLPLAFALRGERLVQYKRGH
jgi:hypothetical protein